MDDRQLRDELVTMFIAGNETTAITMTWLFYLLDRNPVVERKLRAEIEEVVGDRRPTAADLSRMEYTKMVIQEVMRMYPPSWLLPRTAKEDDQICGYPVPAGATVIVSQYVMHHDPAFWEAPRSSTPSASRPSARLPVPRYSVHAVGGGPRQCIGNLFSIMEAQILIAVLLRRLRMRLVPGHPVSPQALTTLRPRHGRQDDAPRRVIGLSATSGASMSRCAAAVVALALRHQLMMAGSSIVKHSTDDAAYLIALYQNCEIWKTCAADLVAGAVRVRVHRGLRHAAVPRH